MPRKSLDKKTAVPWRPWYTLKLTKKQVDRLTELVADGIGFAEDHRRLSPDRKRQDNNLLKKIKRVRDSE